MNIIVFTSADHCYANALLNLLIRRGSFKDHSVVVLEQRGIVPGKSKLAGLWRYLSVAGGRYVFWQVVKKYLFVFVRFLRSIFSRKSSLYYPYWKHGISRQDCPHLLWPATTAFIQSFHPDLILSLFSKEIIPERIFTIPPRGCINLHPAPLPHFRGVSPTFWILANGEKTAGVTLHVIDAGIDTGRIISQKLFATSGIATEHALYMKATALGATMVSDFLGKKITTKNNPRKGSYYSIPTKEAVKEFYARGHSFFRWKEFFYEKEY